MAQKVQVILVDDIDSGEADETVSFALDGVSYEIDLSESNAQELREGLAHWVGHARRVGGRSTARRVAAPKKNGAVAATARPDLSEVRAWAREAGYEVSDRGRVSGEVLKAFEDAH